MEGRKHGEVEKGKNRNKFHEAPDQSAKIKSRELLLYPWSPHDDASSFQTIVMVCFKIPSVCS